MVGRDLVKEVVPPKAFDWDEGFDQLAGARTCRRGRPTQHVVALDYGMKWNILRCLTQVGCKVTVRARHGDGRARSWPTTPTACSCPTAPATRQPLGYAIDTIQRAGRQEADLRHLPGPPAARPGLGAKTFKLKFGHRGANQPVLNQRTGQVEITTQNHGFAVRPDDAAARTWSRRTST